MGLGQRGVTGTLGVSGTLAMARKAEAVFVFVGGRGLTLRDAFFYDIPAVLGLAVTATLCCSVIDLERDL